MNELEVRFIFANHDGVTVNLTATTETKVLDLKCRLLENWPIGNAMTIFSSHNFSLAIPPCNDVSRIRLICMGSAMLKDSASLGMWSPQFGID
jgi:hypothetical protein